MHIIFDLDGTIIDSRNGIIDSFQYSAEKVFGKKINSDELIIGPPIQVMLENVFPNLPSNKVSEFIKTFRSHYDNEGWKNFSVYPKVKHVLELLSEKNNLYIATNKPNKPTCQILKRIKIFNLFDEVSCFDSNKFSNKSDLVSKLVINNTHNYFMVGDSKDDMEAALYNKINFIYCNYGYGQVDCFAHSEFHKIEDFNELIFLNNDNSDK